jgi:hypothetical protein
LSIARSATRSFARKIRLVEYGVDESRLAVVDVRDDRDVRRAGWRWYERFSGAEASDQRYRVSEENPVEVCSTPLFAPKIWERERDLWFHEDGSLEGERPGSKANWRPPTSGPGSVSWQSEALVIKNERSGIVGRRNRRSTVEAIHPSIPVIKPEGIVLPMSRGRGAPLHQ